MKKNKYEIVAIFKKGDRSFIEGRIVGVIHAIAGMYAFTRPLLNMHDETHFFIEATARQYKKICKILASFQMDNVVEFEF